MVVLLGLLTWERNRVWEDEFSLWGDAVAKAQLCADVLFERLALDGVNIPEEDRFVEFVGANVCHEGILPVSDDLGEVVLRIGAKSQDKNVLDRLGREIAPLVTSGPPGITGFAGGRPRATEIVGYWPALIDKTKIHTTVNVVEV